MPDDEEIFWDWSTYMKEHRKLERKSVKIDHNKLDYGLAGKKKKNKTIERCNAWSFALVYVRVDDVQSATMLDLFSQKVAYCFTTPLQCLQGMQKP